MLSIKTDIQNKNWLKYIVKQFKTINLIDFDIEIISLDDKEKYKNIVYHSDNYKKNSINIFNSNEIQPNGNIEYLKDNLFILQNTRDDIFDINYDIFWNAFVFLSRYEEYLSEQNGKNIYSYSLNHPRLDKTSFDIPIVNILFNELEKFLVQNFEGLKFGEKQKPVVDFSHDVDYIKKTIQLRLKQTAFNCFNTLKYIIKPKKFINNMFKTIKFSFSTPSYWCFDYWKDLEKRHNKRSTFYVYVKNGKKNLKSWLIDPSYDIQADKKLQDKLKNLHSEGFKIGLHGSYNSAKDFTLLKQEKEILEKVLEIKVTKTRQHWLNYFENITPYSHEKLFKTDSTLAWNDRIGFRSGCVSLYRPYDFKNEKAFNYEVIPQIIMDSNVYDYAGDTEIFEKAKKIIQTSKEGSKTTYVSISWHQRVCSSDYDWHKFYEEILNDI